MVSRLLDWRLRKVARGHGLPDLPEVRKLMRLAWWNGFTSGALRRQEAAAHEQAREALGRFMPENGGELWLPASASGQATR